MPKAALNMSRTQNQSHATRFHDGQALQERHPDLSEPFHGDVVKDEIGDRVRSARAQARGAREPLKEDLTEKRATALRYPWRAHQSGVQG